MVDKFSLFGSKKLIEDSNLTKFTYFGQFSQFFKPYFYY